MLRKPRGFRSGWGGTDQDCHAVSCLSFRMSQAASKPAVRQSVFQLLTCPLCREYMRPPITLCQAGHNICSSCRSSLLKCPRCERPLLDTRNVALETIARSLVYPCRYNSAGCREKLGMDVVVKHHMLCPHRSYDCPLQALEGCKWTGRYRNSRARVCGRGGQFPPTKAARPDLRSRHVGLAAHEEALGAGSSPSTSRSPFHLSLH
jgi:hypothetical protein